MTGLTPVLDEINALSDEKLRIYSTLSRMAERSHMAVEGRMVDPDDGNRPQLVERVRVIETRLARLWDQRRVEMRYSLGPSPLETAGGEASKYGRYKRGHVRDYTDMLASIERRG